MGRIHRHSKLVPLASTSRRALVLGLAVLVAMAAALSTVLARSGAEVSSSDDLPNFDYVHSNLALRGARAFSEFPVYFAGTEFQGLPLTAIHRRAPNYESAAPGRVNYVSFKYGTCVPTGETGCPAPLEIQTWPACERHPSMYGRFPGVAGPRYPREPTSLRGVPGAFFDGGRSLELYSGEVTIVLWGRAREQLEGAAGALRSVNSTAMPGANATVTPGELLPRPPLEVLERRPECRS